MTDLSQLLLNRHIRKVVIIDDVFDESPQPDELDDENWSIFFDDLGDEKRTALGELFPDYENTDAADLRHSQPFITLLWENRAILGSSGWEQLFKGYAQTNSSGRSALNDLAHRLETLGLECSTLGRDVDDTAKGADLIFMDLFLGHQQSEDDVQRAIERVRTVVEGRMSAPPLVVLMSHSPRLQENRNQFRDEAHLYGSLFRVANKSELAKPGVLERILSRLATNYEDATRVAAFVDAWDKGLDNARLRFIETLRRLDLPDLAQLHTLLLEFEGQRLGDYLLDVSDRVLQHEIESDQGTIEAARSLNEIQLNQYPAPHLAGSPDFQALVHRMVFQHSERLKLSEGNDNPGFTFGDVLREKKSDNPTDRVLLVVTPSCDLARGGIAEVLVLPGTLKSLSVSDWSYGASDLRTPSFTAEDGTTYWIKWALKQRHTVSYEHLRKQIDQPDGVSRIGRMREIYSAEIQQIMLANMGRIGQISNPPASFPVTVSVSMISPDGTPQSIDLPALNEAVCFVGKDKDSKRVDQLVLSEDACDAFRDAVQNLTPENIHTGAHQSLDAMKTDLEFFDDLERGLVKIPKNSGTPVAFQKQVGDDNFIYFHVVRNEWNVERNVVPGNCKKGSLIINVHDASEERRK